MKEPETEALNVVIEKLTEICHTTDDIVKPSSPSKSRGGHISELLHCDKCDYNSHNRHYLKQHIDLVHCTQRPYKCPFCDYAGKRSSALKEHLVVHSTQRPYECPHCNATFRKKGHLTNHTKMHGNRGAFLCNSCNINFNTKEEAIEHVDEVHASGDKTTVFACEECGFSSPDQAEVLNHVNEHVDLDDVTQEVGSVLMYKCAVCGFEADVRSMLEDHMLAHVPSDISPQHLVMAADKMDVEEVTVTKSVYNCLLCSFSTSEAQVMSNHVRYHAGKNNQGQKKQPPVHKKLTPLKVQIPDNPNFVYDPSLAVFRCKICGYTCEHQRTIKSHIWKHSGHQDISYPVFQPVRDRLIKLPSEIPLTGKMAPVIKEILKNDVKIAPKGVDRGSSPKEAVQVPEVVKAPVEEIQLFPATNVNLVEVEVESQNKSENEPPQVIPKRKKQGSDIFTTGEVVVSVTTDNKESQEEITEDVRKRKSDDEKSKENTPKKAKVDDKEKVLKSPKRSMRTRAMQNENNEFDINKGLKILADSLAETDKLKGKNDSTDGSPPSDVVSRDVKAVQDLLSMQYAMARKSKSGRKTRSLTKNEQAVSEVEAMMKEKKSGICSSLLAVIEQLRERSKSETDDAPAPPPKIEPVPPKPPRAKRPKPPRPQPYDDGIPIDQYTNVELFEENGVSSYRCTLCHYKSVSTPLLKQHMRLHKSKQPFECSLCDYVAKSSENLQEHMLMHCKIRIYQCKLCPSAFSYKSQLRAHMRAHNEAEPFSCDLCEFETTKFLSWQTHVKMHADRKDFMCKQCQCQFTNECRQAGHDQFELQYEETILDDENELVIQDSDDSQGDGKSIKSYKCEVCNFTCKTLTGIRSHCRLHIESQLMKCYYCEFVAASMRSLKSHMKRHVNDQRYVQQPLEQYKCKLCGYVCHHLPSLKSHMWRHAAQDNYSYKQANDVINAAIDFNGADKKDLDKEQTKDDLAAEVVEESVLLTERETDSANVVAFRCCQCGYESRDRVGLSAHMHIHMDIITKSFEEESVEEGR